MEKQEIIEKLLKLITKEMENVELINIFKDNPQELINSYFIACSAENINLEIVDLQNKLHKLNEINFIEFNKCKNKIKSNDEYLSLKIRAEYCLVFSSCLIENVQKDSIDNYIILNAGIQIKQDLANLMKEDGYMLSYKKPYIVDGYNLPCGKLIKILYPIKQEAKDLNNLNSATMNAVEQMKEGSTLVVDLKSCACGKTEQNQILQTIKKMAKSKKIKIKLIY